MDAGRIFAALDRTVANTVAQQEMRGHQAASASSSILRNVTDAFRQNDITRVRKLAAQGLPKCCSALRSCVWMQALGHLPEDYLSWDDHLQSSRNQYKAVLNSFMKEHNGDLIQANPAVFDEINKDVYRTRPEVSFFARSLWDDRYELTKEGATANISDPQHHYDLFARVLFMVALNNKKLSYVQGMNEVCAVLYYTFAQDPLGSYEDVEADVFYCMTRLLSTSLQDAFSSSMDHTPNGIAFRLHSFDALLKKKDPQMHEFLHSVKIEPAHYALTWVLLLFAQEVRLTDCQRLWDSILNDTCDRSGNLFDCEETFFNCVCVAVVCSLRGEILGNDYVNAMNWLHRRPFLHGVERVLELAQQIRTPGYVIARTELRASTMPEKRYSEISFSDRTTSTTALSSTTAGSASSEDLFLTASDNTPVSAFGKNYSSSKNYMPLSGKGTDDMMELTESESDAQYTPRSKRANIANVINAMKYSKSLLKVQSGMNRLMRGGVHLASELTES